MGDEPKNGRTGRPPKLTPKLQEDILKYIRLGMAQERACIAAGVAESTLFRWKKKGEREKNSIYYDFCTELKKAEVVGEAILLGRIHSHSKENQPGQWQAAAWILERRYREHYRKSKPEDDAPVTDEFIKQLANAIVGGNKKGSS